MGLIVKRYNETQLEIKKKWINKGGVEIQSRVNLSEELKYINSINGKLCHALEIMRSGSVSYNKWKNKLGCRNSDDKKQKFEFER